jgi:hypothetical protein
VIGWVRWGYLAQKLHPFFDTREISDSWWKLDGALGIDWFEMRETIEELNDMSLCLFVWLIDPFLEMIPCAYNVEGLQLD